MTGQQASPGRPAYRPVGTAEVLLDAAFRPRFRRATPEAFIEVDADLKTMAGEGMANPATRFHLWVFEACPDVNSIIHTHSPWASALAAEREPLVISQMGHNTASDDCVSFGPLIAGCCQSPFELSDGTTVALAPSELVRVAETARARLIR